MDASKANSELIWKTEIPLNEGINQTIKWIKANLDEIRGLSLEYQHKE